MEIFDIGTGELLLIAALALVFIGPKRLSESWTKIGKQLNQLVDTNAWKALRNVSDQITNAPTNMMRDANLEHHLDALERGLDLDVDHSIIPPGRSVSFSSAPPPVHPQTKKAAAKPATKEPKSTKAKKSKTSAGKTKSTKKKRANA